jgi:hypothetical protein
MVARSTTELTFRFAIRGFSLSCRLLAVLVPISTITLAVTKRTKVIGRETKVPDSTSRVNVRATFVEEPQKLDL